MKHTQSIDERIAQNSRHEAPVHQSDSVPPHTGDTYIRKWNRNLISAIKVGRVSKDGTIAVTYLQMMPGRTVQTIPVVLTKISGWTPLSHSDYNLLHSALGSKDMFDKAEGILKK